jgi:hypothetical protein
MLSTLPVRRLLPGAFVVLGAVLSTACSNSSGASGTQFACITSGACTLTTGLTQQTLASVQADCADAKGTGAASCPTAGLVTCCIFFASGTTSEILCDYGDSGAPGDPTATKMCAQ